MGQIKWHVDQEEIGAVKVETIGKKEKWKIGGKYNAKILEIEREQDI
ncbi:MAG: hypothetical protein LBV53_02400 [Mycoplasmataceae bacterium]|nr:hypothetical protein [Mycoplasmataceae bacterium]